MDVCLHHVETVVLSALISPLYAAKKSDTRKNLQVIDPPYSWKI